MPLTLRGLLLAVLGLTVAQPALSWEWRGWIAGEARVFLQDPTDPRQHGNNLSLALQPELYHVWDDGRQSVVFTPFARLDQGDVERTHADIRELTWLFAERSYEWRIGVRKVFWGVTESSHRVDIINQTDLVENPDGEDKLGQPMINLALVRDWGTLDFFLLTGFRERTFAGVEGRPRTIPRVEPRLTAYESSQEERHIDLALRWSHYIGDLDIGLSHFHGTSRDPLLLPADYQGEIVLAPLYHLIDQTGLELQLTRGSWLWKLEAIRRTGELERYNAATAGFEYTFYGLFDSSADLGLVAEYLWDSRGDEATTPFEDDLFAGLRLTLNDVPSSEALLGMIRDREDESYLFSVEASRRFGNNWKGSLEARVFDVDRLDESLRAFARDDYIQLELAYYF